MPTSGNPRVKNAYRSSLLAAAVAFAAVACSDGGPLATAIDGPAQSPAAQGRASDGMPATGGLPGIAGSVLPGMGRAPQDGFARLPDRGDLVGYPKQRAARRAGPHTWHRADVSEAHALQAIASGVLTLTAPSGARLRFAYDRHVEHASGDWTWIGHAVDGDAADDAILTFGAHAVFGTIAQAGQPALKLAMQDGASWLVETDSDALAAQSKASGRYDQPDFLLPPDVPFVQALRAQAATVRGSEAAAATTTVDVLVGYTTGFELANTYANNTGPVMSRLNFLVDVTNESYANSQVPTRVRMVHAMKVSYPDNNDNKVALRALTGSDGKSTPTLNGVDAALRPLHTARDQYGADLISLVRDFQHPEAVSCGVAWLIGGGQSTIHSGYAPYGMSIVSDGSDGGFYCEDTTFAHELGHNMGLAHDIETAKGDNGVLDPDDYGRYPYSFGYRTDPANGNFYTVMAYNEDQVNHYRVFSNPDITICGGFPCGLPGQADNALTLRQTSPIIATFRATVVPETPVQREFTRHDMNGDGRADITWLDVRSRQVTVWLMNGITRTSTASASSVAEGYVPLGLGDFNGDQQSDLLASNGSHVAIGTGNGGGFAHVQILSTQPPSGWDFAGIADVDGNGQADVLWHNVRSGEVYVWLISNAQIVGGRGNSFLPLGHRVAGIGDLNGDGKPDLVTTSSQDVRVAFGQGLGAFASPSLIATHPPALWDFGGVGDFDGDGKADILWHNVRSGELYYWQMSGGAIIGGRGNAFIPIGHRIVDVVDLDADARYDVVSAGISAVHATLGSPTGFGTAMLLAGSRPPSWQLVNSRRDMRSPVDLNGDGRSDVIWHNQWSSELYYWLMNGAAIIEQQGGSHLAEGYTPLVIGDMDGDGLADLVSTNGSLVSLSRGRAGGGFAAPVSIAERPPSTWQFAGLADMNLDSRADIVWHNSVSGELYTWFMNGSAITSGQGGVFVPQGHSVLGMGDLSADGYVDVVTSNGQDVLGFLGTSGGFTAGIMISSRPPADWSLAGIEDVNEDGKADITWHNRISGELYSWIMFNTSIVDGSGGSHLPLDHVVLGMRDLNGDRRPDVLSADGAQVWAALAIPGGGFLPATVVAPLPSAGWNLVPDP